MSTKVEDERGEAIEESIADSYGIGALFDEPFAINEG
jgi:hypothetical protein